MATINRLKNKKKAVGAVQTNQQQPVSISSPLRSESNHKVKNNQSSTYTPQKESQYQSYYEISQCNPIGVTTTSTLFPHSFDMHSQYNLPLGFLFSPLMFLQNENAQIMQKSADRIPRCGSCRAYMNCYNKIQENRFTCFFCGIENTFNKQYDPQQQPNDELNSSIYQVIGHSNLYPTQPPQQTYVFLIDINFDSANTKIMYYAIAAMKEILERSQLDDICIYFFTYDELIQQYDFSGEDIKCTIVDQSIQEQTACKLQPCFLKDIRNKLFSLLDSLQQISQDNHRKGSNFLKCFEYVFSNLKHTGAKFFVLQSNEAITGESFLWEENPKNVEANKVNEGNIKSLFETKNKVFFNKLTQPALKYQCSLSFYIFARNYKNIKVFHDLLKLTNSQLRIYSKDSPTDLDKFYYEFSYYLGANYFKNIIMECLICPGWYYTAIYGNFYRKKQYITFQLNSLEASKKIIALVNPAKPNPNRPPNPYCAIQIITNYRYKRQSFMAVSTIVQPVTGSIQRLYASIDPTNCIAALAKAFLSSLRMQPINLARKKLIQVIGTIYTSASQIFKKNAQIPDSIITIITAVLGMLKSPHSQPQLINNSPTFDKVIGQRNFLQFSGPAQISNLFNPYLFDLSNMDNSMCRSDTQFAYPPTIEVRFQNIKDGLFLLDNGLMLYLFIAKTCDPTLLQEVFGQSKFTRNDILNEELLNKQDTFRANQVQTLVKYLREQKVLGWIPLYVIRCGQNTLNQKNFYLNFYQQKYQEFRNYKLTVQQFIAMIARTNTF